MNVRIKVYGRFDRVGEQLVTEATVLIPGEVPVRWTVKILWFRVTIVGRVTVEAA